MSTKFYTLLTEIGAAKLASATALGVPLKITHMAVGDGGGALPTPDAKQTALVNEKRRAALNMLYIDPQNSSQIIAEQVIPENEGGWWIREVGLFDESGALIAVGNCPESYKPQLAEGSGRTQTVRIVLITSSTDNITLKIDPAVVLATRKYVDDKALELKVYVDDLMAKHLAAPDPHSQYAPKASPTFTGTPKAPTPAAGNNTTQVATTAFVQAALTALINGAPATLDTLKEIAAAINNDPKFSTTINNALSGKQPLDETLTHLSGKDVAGLLAYLGLGASAFGIQNRVVISATGVTQWSVPDVLKKGRKCKVKVIGAGGSGGVGNAVTAAGQSAIAGGGGGSGGISESLLDLTGIDSVTVTVGVGGTPVTSLSTNGVSGGTSSFGSYLSATGGIGGGQPSGGESGIGTGGDTNSSGGPGSPGGVLNADNNGVPSMSGGSGGGPGGNGAAQLSAANKAADAKAPGGGGAGLKPSSGSGITSGRGGDGLVIIEW
ncbi:phage tail protein [Escherichia coli]|nr:phage tail protein [Escherichia coli]MDD8975833.1 phage tail protein [Escherichia coli]